MKSGKLIAMCVCLALLMASGGEAWAKKKDKEAASVKAAADDRILHGHNFLRPYGFPLAMPTTNVGVGLGYAYFSFKMDEPVDMIFLKEDEFHTGGLNEVLDFEIEFLDRFSTEFLIEGRALVGADDASALIYGGVGLWAGSFIPKVMLYQNDNWGTCISISSDVIYDMGAQTSPALLMVKLLNNMVDLLEDVERTQEIPSENDLQRAARIQLKDATITTQMLSVRPSLLYAQTIHPVFGIQIGVRYDYGIQESVDAPELLDEEMDPGDPPSALMLGGVATFDLNPISRAHFGFKFEGDYEMEKDDGDDYNTTTLGGGIIYTGRKDLDLGATFFRATIDSADGKEEDLYAILNMRYFW